MKTVFERIFMLSALLGCGLLCVADVAEAQQDEGEALFKQVCVACHTIGGGKLIGPDLANVQQRRPQEWILSFVKSSQSVIKGGDAYAAALFEAYNNIPMPDNNFTDAQILNIIAYIAANSAGGGQVHATATASGEPDVFSQPVTDENVRSGEMLFAGTKRFESGGPTCISCHTVQYDGVMSGGALAKDLTDAHSRLTAAGTRAMIRTSPFPAMRQAFERHPFTDQEVFDLAAFLQRVDSEKGSHGAQNYLARVLLSGMGGALILFGLLGGVWLRAKKRSVNHAIYTRQVKSTWEFNDSEQGGKS